MLLPLAQLTATTSPTGAPPAVSTPAAPTPPAVPAGPEAAAPPPAPATNPGGTTLKSVDGAASHPATPQSPFGNLMFPMIILMFVVLYFVMFRGQRKDEKKRKTMIAEMKKGDRVMTIGGLVARVVSIDDQEVVLKIDESANVKATYTKSSIQRILGNEEKK